MSIFIKLSNSYLIHKREEATRAAVIPVTSRVMALSAVAGGAGTGTNGRHWLSMIRFQVPFTLLGITCHK